MATRQQDLETAIDAMAAELAGFNSSTDIDRATKIAALIKSLREASSAEDHPIEIESQQG